MPCTPSRALDHPGTDTHALLHTDCDFPASRHSTSFAYLPTEYSSKVPVSGRCYRAVTMGEPWPAYVAALSSGFSSVFRSKFQAFSGFKFQCGHNTPYLV